MEEYKCQPPDNNQATSKKKFILRGTAELYEKKKVLKKKEKDEYWLNEWIKKRRNRRQQEFIKYLKTTVPKERWNRYGEKYIRRFVSRIDIGTNDDCWKWLGRFLKEGYGQFDVEHKRAELSHRFMYMIMYGEIPEGKEVCHSCNNSSCVNPNHLYADTHKGNMEYMIKSGRSYDRNGEKNPNSELTYEIVSKIREDYKKGLNGIELSRKYEILTYTIYRIVNNNQWIDKEYQTWLDGNYETIKRRRSENNGVAKMTWKEVNEIRELWKTGKYSQYQLAFIFGLSQAEIGNIVNNVYWHDSNYQEWIDNEYMINLNISGFSSIGKASDEKRKLVNEIRDDWKTCKYTQYQLAKKHKVPRGTVQKIVTNVSWYDKDYQRWLDRDEVEVKEPKVEEIKTAVAEIEIQKKDVAVEQFKKKIFKITRSD